MAQYVYMEISKDKYELPVAIANSVPELARITGYSENVISSTISHAKNKQWRWSKFIKVEIEDERAGTLE